MYLLILFVLSALPVVLLATFIYMKDKNNDLYLLNEEFKEKNKFIKDYNYQLVLYTSNYDYDKKFKQITVTEYDYNIDLTNEKVIYSGKWFKQIKLDIQFNKIYVYELTYENGDYVCYTFNTYLSGIE